MKEKLVIEHLEESKQVWVEVEAARDYEHLDCVYCGSDNIIENGTRKTKVGIKTKCPTLGVTALVKLEYLLFG